MIGGISDRGEGKMMRFELCNKPDLSNYLDKKTCGEAILEWLTGLFPKTQIREARIRFGNG